MRFESALEEGKLLKRYKRFLADIRTPGGEVLTVHCPNTGSMKHCQEPGSRVWYSASANRNRKYPHTWHIVESAGKYLVGINTSLANRLVLEAIESGVIAQLTGYGSMRAEVPYGQRSRIDLLLEGHASHPPQCYVEIKNVTLGMGQGLGLFPDAVTSRGQKHLRELMGVRQEGARALLLFCVQHEGIDRVAPADTIDPEYGRLLRLAQEEGVEILAYAARFDLSAAEVSLQKQLPVEL